MNSKTARLTTAAMLCAVAYVAMALFRIPVVLFLKYEPKDVIIAIGGFLMGPFVSLTISTAVALVEMVTVSDTGPIGCVMNILSSCSFACTAALIYTRKRTLGGAAAGLAAGCLLMTAVMLLWNYLITPLYMGYPRQAVAELLLPAFLPFNLLKGGLNTALTLLLYKPVTAGLRRMRITAAPEEEAARSSRIGLLLAAGLLLISCVLIILVWTGML